METMIMETPSRRVLCNPSIKDKITFIRTAEESHDAITEIEVELAPKGGNDLHYHKSFDEEFTAIEGNLGLEVNGRKITLKPGETAIAKKGEHHRFFNPSDTETILFIVRITPGNTGFENCLRIAYGLANDGKIGKSGLPSIPVMALLMEMGDTGVTGGIGAVVKPLFKLIARRARRRGLELELLKKYVF